MNMSDKISSKIILKRKFSSVQTQDKTNSTSLLSNSYIDSSVPIDREIEVLMNNDSNSLLTDTQADNLKPKKRGRKPSQQKSQNPNVNVRILYDLDSQDIEWLKIVNSSREDIIESEILQKTIDKINKATKRIKEANKAVPTDDDSPCEICYDSESYEDNVMIFCDSCDMAVHQFCYGVKKIPKGEWICQKCKSHDSLKIQCELCPYKDGCLKTTTSKGWCHVICALMVPGVVFGDAFLCNSIDCSQVDTNNRHKRCSLCDLNYGAVIKCFKSKCAIQFHAYCAQNVGLLFFDNSDDIDQSLVTSPSANSIGYFAYCQNHLSQNHIRLSEEQKQKIAKLQNSHESTNNILSYSEIKKIADTLTLSDGFTFCKRVEAYLNSKNTLTPKKSLADIIDASMSIKNENIPNYSNKEEFTTKPSSKLLSKSQHISKCTSILHNLEQFDPLYLINSSGNQSDSKSKTSEIFEKIIRILMHRTQGKNLEGNLIDMTFSDYTSIVVNFLVEFLSYLQEFYEKTVEIKNIDRDVSFFIVEALCKVSVEEVIKLKLPCVQTSTSDVHHKCTNQDLLISLFVGELSRATNEVRPIAVSDVVWYTHPIKSCFPYIIKELNLEKNIISIQKIDRPHSQLRWVNREAVTQLGMLFETDINMIRSVIENNSVNLSKKRRFLIAYQLSKAVTTI